MLRPSFCRFLTLSISAVCIINAAPMAPIPLPLLVDNSDVIVIGKLTNVSASGNRQGTLNILPSESIKGNLPAGPMVVAFSDLQAFDDHSSLFAKDILLFVKRSADRAMFSLVPVQTGASLFLDWQMFVVDAAASFPALRGLPSDTPLQRVIKEMANNYAVSNNSLALPYLHSLASSRTEPELLKTVYRTFIASPSAGHFEQGIRGLLAFGDIEGLEALNGASAEVRSRLPQAMRDDFERNYKDTSPEGVTILSQWLQQQRPAAERQAAAGALARVHTAGAIAVLGPYLDDPDYEIRWKVVGGLSMFANNVPIGSYGASAPGNWSFGSDDTHRFSMFDSRGLRAKGEESYLQFWRGWWQEHQAAIRDLATERR